ncbi:MAG TPA: zf-TFIIB domain-containing protein [Gammaproteobacteria bacterium]
MKCPVCKDVNLTMSDRQGIEIDYCPECRGVWLDRGELDKLIERASPEPQRQPERDTGYSRQASHDHHGHSRKKKRSSLLGDLFDF